MPWPRLDTCPDCGADVLKARTAAGSGRPYVLEPIEVVPFGKCGPCNDRGWVPGELRYVTPRRSRGRGAYAQKPAQDVAAVHRRRVTCRWCDGTGQRGVPLVAGDHVLVDTHGHARIYRGGRDYRPGNRQPLKLENASGRLPGEAAHRRHRCQPQTLALVA